MVVFVGFFMAPTDFLLRRIRHHLKPGFLLVDFDMKMDEVVDGVFSEEAEGIAGAVVAAASIAVEFKLARALEAPVCASDVKIMHNMMGSTFKTHHVIMMRHFVA